jgi:hypothetical protein
MRRLIESPLPLILLIAAAFLAGSCRRSERARLELTEEEPPALASVVHVADPAASAQLLKGFYALEQNSWRWTAGAFSVALRPPARAAERGARLQVSLAIPEVVVQRLGALTLKATVGSAVLPPETYSKPGDHVYSREVPASALAGNSVVVDFALDKTLAPGGGDERQLGIIVTTIGLEAK